MLSLKKIFDQKKNFDLPDRSGNHDRLLGATGWPGPSG